MIYRCEMQLGGFTCGGTVGHTTADGAFRRSVGGVIVDGPAWCPRCRTKYKIRSYMQGRRRLFAMRPVENDLKPVA